MAGKRARITANEINKYLYCPHQWYYERAYGGKELRERYRELHPDSEIAANENFARGRVFHETYERRERNRTAAKAVAAVIVFIAAAVFLLYKGVL